MHRPFVKHISKDIHMTVPDLRVTDFRVPDQRIPKPGITILRAAVLLLPALFLLLLSACDQSSTPKPAGYPRIDFPEKAYRPWDSLQSVTFEIPEYSYISMDPMRQNGEALWFNLEVPQLRGKVHLSYREVEGNLQSFISDCRKLAYKHSVKAEGIEETPFIDRGANRFGMVYDLSGDVASAVQFFITDSTTHFLRGSLYFDCTPNRDSLRPVIGFLREDIMHLIETTQWKYH